VSQGLIVRCPACAARLRLQPGRELPDRFKVRCSECGKPFLVRRRVEAAATGAAPAPPLDQTLVGQRVPAEAWMEEHPTHVTPPAGPAGAVAAAVSTPRPAPQAMRTSPDLSAAPATTVTGRQPPPGPPARTGSVLGSVSGDALGRGPEPAGSTFAGGQLVGGRYRIERFLAKGGMGEVYEAFDVALGEAVALKTVRPDVAADELALERFKREIQLARQVTHRNVCRIHDLGTHRSESAAGSFYPGGEILFVSMELLRGESLSDRLARMGSMTEEHALPLVRQMIAALDAAHAAGIVHRDFKCANVVLEPGEGGERVVVTDFGLARGGQGGETAATLTVAGAVMGSPAYMAPEQVEGGKMSPAVDVYALGVVLFEMVTGRLPFKGESPLSTAVKRLTEPPPRPTEVKPGVDARWEEVILRCLARQPEERFQHAGDVLAALDPSPLAAALGTSRLTRRRLWLAVAAGFLVALALAANYQVWRERAAREGGQLVAPAVARPAVALLALRNVTGEEGLDWLSSGLPEMLSSELSAGGAVRLIPGENVSRTQLELGLEPGATWGNETLERVRRHLGSDYLVTGAYTAVGGPNGQLRLDLRLQDTLTSGNSRAVAVSGPRDAVFDLVAEAGAKLREALDLGGDGGGRWRGGNPEAVRLYTEGLERLRRFDALGARRLLEQAVAIDPRNARIQAALASALSSLGYQQKAREAAQRAVELSAPLEESERHEIRAQYLEAASDWPGAARAWEELWRRFPDNLEYGLELAQALVAAGDPRRALEVAAVLRRLPSAAADDLRIPMTEAAAAGALGDSRKQQEAAHQAAEVALAQGARLRRAGALLQEGWALRNLGDAGRAQGVTAEAEGLFQQAGDESGVANARVQRASLLYDQGELASARRLFDQALATYRELGDKGSQAQALNNLAVVLKQQGQVDTALAMYEESRQISEETGSRVGVANAENNIGAIRLKRGDLAGALTSFRRALELSRGVDDRNLQAYALYNIAGTLRRQGRLAEAEARHREALELRREIGQRIGEVASLTDLGAVYWDRGDLAQARTSYEGALALARATGNRRFEGYALAGLGQVRLGAGELAEAERLHRQALVLREELGEQASAAESRLLLAVVALEAGRFAEAEGLARQAEQRLAAEGFVDLVSSARAARARALVYLQRADEAREVARLAGESGGSSEDVRVRCEVALARARVAGATGRLAEAQALAGEAAATAERAGFLLLQLEGNMLMGQLAALGGDEARGAELVADARARAERSGMGLLSRRAGVQE
jgi:tetratricopeptide (TPR) repeat protein